MKKIARTATAALFVVAFHASVGHTALRSQDGPPDRVQIEDPAGDANYVNDHSVLSETGNEISGNVSTPADVSQVADILAVWFTNTNKKLTAHIQTESTDLGAGDQTSIHFFVRATAHPDVPEACIYMTGAIHGANRTYSADHGWIHNCSGWWRAKTKMSELPDGTGHITITGQIPSCQLAYPTVTSGHAGDNPLPWGHYAQYTDIDDTNQGSTYVLDPSPTGCT